MPSKSSNKVSPNVLRFIASLIFLYVVFQGVSGSASMGAAALWSPILYSIGVLGSVVLFFTSLGGIGLNTNKFTEGAMKSMKLAAFALFALSVISGTLAVTNFGWLVILGYVIGWFGSAIEK